LEDTQERGSGGWQAARRVGTAIRLVVGIIRRAAPYQAAVVLILQLLSGAATAFGLLATTSVLEELLAEGPTARRLWEALPDLALLVAAFAARGAMDTGVALAQARLVPAVRREAEERLVDASLRVGLAAFDDASFYDRMHRARDRGLMRLEQAVEEVVVVIGALLAVVAAAGSLSVLHPLLLPVLLLGVLPEGWAVLRAARLEYDSLSRTISWQRRVWMIIELATTRQAAGEIRAYQAAPFVLQEYRQVADALRDNQIRVGVAQARTRALGRAMAGVGIGATFTVLGLLLYAGWIPLAVAGTAVVAVRTATGSLSRLVLAANELFEHGRYIADYQSFLADAESRAPRPTGRAAPTAPREITVDNVSFRYPGSPSDQFALRDVSLTIHTGQTVALVGENGSGKSTLAKLIAGLYRPTTGRVTWDGIDLTELNPDSIADRVVMVSQEPVKWPHTARVNVRLGRYNRSDPDDVALTEAAEQARADEVIARLPRRWDTLLSKYFRGGHELSGGQWQRLAVARGLFRDAPLLIWDEPTAPLDAKAEYAVYESLRRLAGGRTVVLITHRMASVRHADRIYLLHEGRIVEQGTHDELIALGGRYAELHAIQARLHGGIEPEPRQQTHERGDPVPQHG